MRRNTERVSETEREREIERERESERERERARERAVAARVAKQPPEPRILLGLRVGLGFRVLS